MTEKEIVEFLQKNREIGIAYPFYPEEVKAWIDKHWYVVQEFHNGYWVSHSDGDPTVSSGDVYSLPDGYVLNNSTGSGWVEIPVDDDVMIEYSEGSKRFRYHYLQYEEIVIQQKCGFRYFGGFKFEEDGQWYMHLAVKCGSTFCLRYQSGRDDVLPAEPIAVRFWKEKKDE